MTLLVTGAGGFVGTHLVASARAEGWTVHESQGDLREARSADDAVAAAAPDAVAHLASARRSATGWRLLEDELRMAGNLLAAVDAHAPGIPVLVLGSAAQYGDPPPEPVAETAPLRPLTPYAAVKCALETACTARALAGSARVVWARCFNLVGPGQPQDAPVASWAQQIAAAGERAEVRTGDLSVVRDFLDVRDAARACLRLLEVGRPGPVNLGSGEGVRLETVLDELAAVAGVPVEAIADPRRMRRDDPRHVVADVTRLRELTGWRPEIPRRESLRAVLEEAAAARSGHPAARA